MTGIAFIVIGIASVVTLMRLPISTPERWSIMLTVLGMVVFIVGMMVILFIGDLPREYNGLMLVALFAILIFAILQFFKVPVLVRQMNLPGWLKRPVTAIDIILGGIIIGFLIFKHAVVA